MKITFVPDSDLSNFIEGVNEYEEIWREHGLDIVKAWEKVTGLTFKETFINATVFNKPSFSHPLSLNCRPNKERKTSILVHELGHRLLYGRQVEIPKDSLENHKVLFLVLKDVFIELFGKKFADDAVQWDRELPRDLYRQAWDWALSHSHEERLELFETKITR